MAEIKWKSQTEIEAEELLKSLEPSQEEVEKAKTQVLILLTLMEVELI